MYLCIVKMEKTEVSVLIPNYNNVCVDLVTVLQRQAEALGIDYEIIVADDHSPQKEKVREKQKGGWDRVRGPETFRHD